MSPVVPEPPVYSVRAMMAMPSSVRSGQRLCIKGQYSANSLMVERGWSDLDKEVGGTSARIHKAHKSHCQVVVQATRLIRFRTPWLIIPCQWWFPWARKSRLKSRSRSWTPSLSFCSSVSNTEPLSTQGNNERGVTVFGPKLVSSSRTLIHHYRADNLHSHRPSGREKERISIYSLISWLSF